MRLQPYILHIQTHLIATHHAVLHWFNEPEEVKTYRPQDQGWTILEILEHIALTSHFLLKLIDKGAEKALRNIRQLNLSDEIDNESFDVHKIDAIGVHQSFDWIRPEHMEPSGKKSEDAVKSELITQLGRCLAHLESLKDGSGLLYKTTMTVNGLGQLNVYEYIFFLSKHAERHLTQMQKNKSEMEIS